MIRTTINISNEVHRKLQKVAEKRGAGIEEVIIVLLKYFSKKFRKEIITSQPVQYQERTSDECRKRVHVEWFVEEYEFLIDLRKVHKKSVSFLIAEAVMTLLSKIWSYIDGLLDKYQVPPYSIVKFSIHNAIGCLFLWGKPIKSIK